MIIREALESDLPAIIDIYNATVPTRMVTAELEPTTVEARLPWFREHSPDQHPFWVAESDGCVIGWWKKRSLVLHPSGWTQLSVLSSRTTNRV